MDRGLTLKCLHCDSDAFHILYKMEPELGGVLLPKQSGSYECIQCGHVADEVEQEAATYLSTTKRALYDLVKRGGIPCRRIGRKYIFRKTEIETWMDQLPGITVAQAIKAIQPEHREMWIKGSVRMRYEEPSTPRPSGLLRRGSKGTYRA